MKVRVLTISSDREVANRGKTEDCIGPHPDSPKLCIHCHKPFAQGQAWQRITSPPDPEFGTYTFGIHKGCVGKTPGAK